VSQAVACCSGSVSGGFITFHIATAAICTMLNIYILVMHFVIQ